MAVTEYTYNSCDDELAPLLNGLESRIGDSAGDPEADFFDMLNLLLAIKQGGSVLDIGSGPGRIISIASRFDLQIVGLEPDQARWHASHSRFHTPPKITVFNQTTTEFIEKNPATQFDLIVVSHVIQHTSTASAKAIIQDSAQLLKPGGLVLLSTTHVPEQHKGFNYSGNKKNSSISENEFNQYVESPASQKSQGLPVRHFSKQDLINELSPHFDVIYWRQFSYYHQDLAASVACYWETPCTDIINAGISQMVVMKNRLHG
jgi:cyclopropane fatty-acyl-phospholipid synthase-like methyltransferase